MNDDSQTASSPPDGAADVHASLRANAKGLHDSEAAVELLIRAFDGRFAESHWPWVGTWDWGQRTYWSEGDAIDGRTDALSGGERRLLAVVRALATGDPIPDLGGTMAGLGRPHQALVLAALSHAGGTQQRTELHRIGAGAYQEVTPGALVPWPETTPAPRQQDPLPITARDRTITPSRFEERAPVLRAGGHEGPRR